MVGYIKSILMLHAIFFWVFSCILVIIKPKSNIDYLLSIIVFLISLGFYGVLHAIENK
jgi:hypothetical protein